MGCCFDDVRSITLNKLLTIKRENSVQLVQLMKWLLAETKRNGNDVMEITYCFI